MQHSLLRENLMLEMALGKDISHHEEESTQNPTIVVTYIPQ